MGRNQRDREEGEKHVGLLRLAQILTYLVVFAGGVVMGLTTSSHIHNTNFISLPLHNYLPISNCSTTAPSPLPPPPPPPPPLDMADFLHPPNLTHTLSDDELFWRASLMPNKEGYPFRRIPKVAFMFLTRGPLPMLPLWERFFNGHAPLFNIYVHAPPRFHLNVSLSSPFYARQIPSQVKSHLIASQITLVSPFSFLPSPHSCSLIVIRMFRGERLLWQMLRDGFWRMLCWTFQTSALFFSPRAASQSTTSPPSTVISLTPPTALLNPTTIPPAMAAVATVAVCFLIFNSDTGVKGLSGLNSIVLWLCI